MDTHICGNRRTEDRKASSLIHRSSALRRRFGNWATVSRCVGGGTPGRAAKASKCVSRFHLPVEMSAQENAPLRCEAVVYRCDVYLLSTSEGYGGECVVQEIPATLTKVVV